MSAPAPRPRVLALLAFACAAGIASAQVVPRKGAALPAGQVAGVAAQGVTIRGPSGDVLVGWDQVAQVQGEFAPDAAAFADLADAAWRARVRMEAGDLGGAEPLLEQASALLTASGVADGPTAALVRSGLLRCRIARGAHASAVEAWLSLVESGRGEFDFRPPWAGSGEARPDAKSTLVDAATGLVPSLPPIFAPTLGLRVLTRLDADPPADAPAQPAQGQARARAREFRALYAAAARAELGESTPGAALSGERRPLDEGLALAWDVVASRAGSAEQQERAVAALTQRLDRPDLPGWQEAWARAALGRVMLRSTDAEERRQGIFMLLHLPARLSDHAPSLAGIALEDIAGALDAEGDVEAARRVRERLERDFPAHPGATRRGAGDAQPEATAPHDRRVDNAKAGFSQGREAYL